MDNIKVDIVKQYLGGLIELYNELGETFQKESVDYNNLCVDIYSQYTSGNKSINADKKKELSFRTQMIAIYNSSVNILIERIRSTYNTMIMLGLDVDIEDRDKKFIEYIMANDRVYFVLDKGAIKSRDNNMIDHFIANSEKDINQPDESIINIIKNSIDFNGQEKGQ